MKNIFRYFLLFIAFVGVIGLGVYVFGIYSHTLTLPIKDGYSHEGNDWKIIFDKPIFSSSQNICDSKNNATTSGACVGGLLNITYLQKSIRVNGILQKNSPAGIQFEQHENILSIQIVSGLKDNDLIIIDSAYYNALLSDSDFRLPHDFIFRFRSNNPSVVIDRIGLPRDLLYGIQIYGFSSVDIFNNLHFYSSKKINNQCFSYQNDWNLDFTEIGGKILDIIKIGNGNFASKIELANPIDYNNECIFAGINGELLLIENSNVSPFIVSGEIQVSASPEIDMKSQVSFSFSSPIYSDTGGVNSKDFIDNRTRAKIDFLKHLSINGLDITIDDIILYPQRAIVTLPLQIEKKYTMSINDLEDIYGQSVSYSFPVKISKDPYLSIRLKEKRRVFTAFDNPKFRVFSYGLKNNQQSISLCRVDIDTFSRLEQIEDIGTKDDSSDLSGILSGSGLTKCQTRKYLINSADFGFSFQLSDFSMDIKNGLYVAFLSDKEEISGIKMLVRPIIFSIINTNITAKISQNGDIFLLATDLFSGKPIGDLDIKIYKNIIKTKEVTWNSQSQKYDTKNIPISADRFSTGITIGKTDEKGVLSLNINQFIQENGYGSAYALTFEDWWGSSQDGSYQSFVLFGRDVTNMGYVVSTWNDGIAPWNFGFNLKGGSEYAEGYAYNQSPLTMFLHTDRKLYLPSDTVHIHGIIRERKTGLVIPSKKEYILIISDPNGKQVHNSLLRMNEFGSISFDYKIPTESPLGSYSFQIQSSHDQTVYIENAYGNFQVEIFKNPSFEVLIDVAGNELDKDGFISVEKQTNDTNQYTWYDNVYKGVFTLQAKIRSQYYNGAIMRNAKFTYRIYKQEFWGNDYWNNCFWGCYNDAVGEFYTEGSEQLDADGYGMVRVPINFFSYFSDYKYIFEVTVVDPLTNETITNANSILVKIPENIKGIDQGNVPNIVPQYKFLEINKLNVFQVLMQHGTWNKNYNNKFIYSIFRREYENTSLEDVTGGHRPIIHSNDIEVFSGFISSSGVGIKDGIFTFSKSFSVPGEYYIKTRPFTTGSSSQLDSTINNSFFVYSSGGMSNPKIDDNKIHIFLEKDIYHIGDTAKLFVRLPFSKGKILMTVEKDKVIYSDYIDVSSNTFIHSFLVDEKFFPNAYISIVAIETKEMKGVAMTSGSLNTLSGISVLPEYRVGYAEIIVDQSDKKMNISISSDKNQYKTQDTVDLSLSMKDQKGKPIIGEFTVMVVDDSLIALLGNIDLDILPKFYQKLIFANKTILTLLGMDENSYFSRKGSAGGGGGKGGDSLSSTRTSFKNTAYYNSSIKTDEFGYAKIKFPLSDNITNYRIIVIGNSKDSFFGASEKTIQVRKDFLIEPKSPYIIRGGDRFFIDANIFNNTKEQKLVYVKLDVDAIDIQGSGIKEFLLLPGKPNFISFPVSTTIGKGAKNIPYILTVTGLDGKIIDSIQSTIQYAEDPIIIEKRLDSFLLTGSLDRKTQIDRSNLHEKNSTVTIRLSPTFLAGMNDILKSFLVYPYGCIEQTISSTLPNVLLLNIGSLISDLSIDKNELLKNINVGILRIKSMQHDNGGFVYWPGESIVNNHITPYVLRSLVAMKELGADVPIDMIERVTGYIESNIGEYITLEDKADLFWTLARIQSPLARTLYDSIDSKQLNGHALLSYAYGRHYLDVNKIVKFDQSLLDATKVQILSKADGFDSWYYWDKFADKAILASILLDRTGQFSNAEKILDELSMLDWNSYYYSTQSKYQTFLAFFKHAKKIQQYPTTDVTIHAGDIKQVITIGSDNLFQSLSIPVSSIGSAINFSLKSQYPIRTSIMYNLFPADPYVLPSKDSGVHIKRSLFEVDEEAGVISKDAYNSEFVHTIPIINGVIKKGKLYKVLIEAFIPTKKDMSWTDFAIEDFLPGGYHPLNKTFKTTEMSVKMDATNWGFSYVENKIDRIFAHAAWGYGDSIKYEYFFRPEWQGEYMWPPATGYYLYNPYLMGYTSFEKIIVE